MKKFLLSIPLFVVVFMPSLVNGVTVLKSQVPALLVSEEEQVSTVSQPFVAIPYYAWHTVEEVK
jgi:hypothetical protein